LERLVQQAFKALKVFKGIMGLQEQQVLLVLVFLLKVLLLQKKILMML
jgi:hypothetical protein